MPETTHSTFTERNFYPAFQRDLSNAKGLVIIQSPYLSLPRIEMLAPVFHACVQRGVTICIFIQAPGSWNPKEREARTKLTATGVAMLERSGVHVIAREAIHEKVVIIDDQILWDGSLNLLSQSNSSERMTRWSSREKVLEALQMHRFHDCAPLLGLKSAFDPSLATYQLNSDLSRTIRYQRAVAEWSQIDLAKRSGVQRRGLSRREGASGNPRMDGITKIVSTLEMRLLPIPWYLIPSVEALLLRHFPPDNFAPSSRPNAPQKQRVSKVKQVSPIAASSNSSSNQNTNEQIGDTASKLTPQNISPSKSPVLES